MKMKNRSLKKWLCLILALVLALSSGCGASEDKQADKTQKEDAEKSEKEKEDTAKPEPEDETETDITEESSDISSGEYDALLKKAQDYEAEGAFDQALASYDLAIRLDPGKADAYIGKSQVYIGQEQYQEAQSVIEKLLDEDPTLPEGWALKCGLDAMTGDVQAFEEDVVFAEVCEADLSPYAILIGIMYADISEYKKAVVYFEAADLREMADTEKDAFRKALIATGSRERAEALGLTPVNIKDRKLDARFEQDHLVLRETRNGGLHLSPRDLVLTEEFKAYYTEANDEELDFDRYLEDAIDSADEDGDMPQIMSFSPTGRSGLAAFGDTLATFYDGKCYLLYPSATHGLYDSDNMVSDIKWVLFQLPQSIMHSSEVIYSPNGRYAVIQSPYRVVTAARFLSPILIDLASGEMILLHDCSKSNSSGAILTFITGTFSSDGQYFYYTIHGSFGDSRQALFRYDIAEDSSEMCISYDPNFVSFSDLAELDDGSLLAMCEQTVTALNERSSAYLQFSQKGGRWTSSWSENPLKYQEYGPVRFLYSSNSGYAVVYGRTTVNKENSIYCTFQVLRPNDSFDGRDIFYCIDIETEKIVSFTAEEYKELFNDEKNWVLNEPYLRIGYSPELSADGNYLLLHTMNPTNPGNDCLYLVRLEDMEIKKVQGIDSETLRNRSMGLSTWHQHFDWKTDQIIAPWNNGFSTYTFE